jgi:hypothetical protein
VIEVFDELKNPLLQIRLTQKVASFEELSHQNAKPHLNLIEPGTMLGGEVEDNPMGGVG